METFINLFFFKGERLHLKIKFRFNRKWISIILFNYLHSHPFKGVHYYNWTFLSAIWYSELSFLFPVVYFNYFTNSVRSRASETLSLSNNFVIVLKVTYISWFFSLNHNGKKAGCREIIKVFIIEAKFLKQIRKLFQINHRFFWWNQNSNKISICVNPCQNQENIRSGYETESIDKPSKFFEIQS